VKRTGIGRNPDCAAIVHFARPGRPDVAEKGGCMEAGNSLLARYTLVDTRSPDEARQEVGRIFCPHFLSPSDRRAEGFHAVHRSARQRGCSVNFVSYGSEVEIDPGELSSFFLLQIPLTGSASVRCGTETALVSPGKAASLLSPTLPTRMRWSDGCDKLILLIERGAMERQCELMAGRPVDKVEFATAIDTASSLGHVLLGHARLMVEAVEAETAIPGDYLARLGESLASLLLTAFPHSQRAALDRAALPAGSAAVRRAEAWIRANIDRAFAVGDIAEAAGTSLRSLQEAIRREQGTTLTHMIEGIRLDGFRRALADNGNYRSVTEIAGAVGIGHLGRAAAAYRRRYGETPSETRRRR
jgi:AraC-like DNA-binding protein